MCLKIDKVKTEGLRKSNEKTVIRYKVLRIIDGVYTSIYQTNYVWQKGWNVPTMDVIDTLYPFEIRGGALHVFISKNDAQRFNENFGSLFFVVPVICHIDDLMAAGTMFLLNEEMRFDTEAYKSLLIWTYTAY